MLERYRKNFILFDGAIYYCLLCDELLGNIHYLEKHLRCNGHKNGLEKQAYCPAFKKEFIYQVQEHFYCELCNIVVSDIDAATKHVDDVGHKAVKTKPKAERTIKFQYDSGYVIKDKIKLNMAQWNSIVDKKCLVCNVEVKNNSSHIRMKEHIIKMNASEILAVFEERYYREIKVNKYHCLTCKDVFSAQNMYEHGKICKNVDESDSNKQKEREGVKPKQIYNRRVRRLLEFFLVDKLTHSATCKQCKTRVSINFPVMFKHLYNHYDSEELKTFPHFEPDTEGTFEEKAKKYFEITDHGKRRMELAKYGKENSIKLNFNGRKGWCLLCNRFMTAHKNSFEQHVIGATHQGNLELGGIINLNIHDARPVKTKSIFMCRLEFLFESEEFYLLDCLRIDVFSFFLLYRIEDPHFKKTKCFACDELVPQGQESEHCKTAKHKRKFRAAKYVMSFEDDGEFIREVRRNYFHCGFCNKVFPFMEKVREHIVSLQHKTLQTKKTGLCLGSIKFNTKSGEVYYKLLHYGFGKE